MVERQKYGGDFMGKGLRHSVRTGAAADGLRGRFSRMAIMEPERKWLDLYTRDTILAIGGSAIGVPFFLVALAHVSMMAKLEQIPSMARTAAKAGIQAAGVIK